MSSAIPDLLENMMFLRRDARSMRVSSWDHSGRNKDYWKIPPRQSAVLADLDGPGCIKHIWLTSFSRRLLGPGLIDAEGGNSTVPVFEISNALGVNYEETDPAYFRKALIKMTWEGQEHPSVLTPLGDFFCIGHSLPGNFASLPFNVSVKPEERNKFGAQCACNCYMPMPFNRSARIEIVNENDLPLGLCFHVDYELYKKPFGEDAGYFHASWRREFPCDGWAPDLQVNTPEVNRIANLDGEGNYLVLEAEGAGQFVGCNLSVKHFGGNWVEGDDMIFIDGEKLPSINGTGTEDYFGHAWGLQKNNFPFNGTTIHGSDMPGYWVSYRFHVPDPIRFNKSIRVTMEHSHANQNSDDWSSTAYWYQNLPAKPITIQPMEERLPLIPEIRRPNLRKPAMTEEMLRSHEDARVRREAYAAVKDRQIREWGEFIREAEISNKEMARRIHREFMSS